MSRTLVSFTPMATLGRVKRLGLGLTIGTALGSGLILAGGCQQRVVNRRGFDEGLGPETTLSEKAQQKREEQRRTKPQVTTSRGQ